MAIDPPWRLDPFKRIVSVGWGGFFLNIVFLFPVEGGLTGAAAITIRHAGTPIMPTIEPISVPGSVNVIVQLSDVPPTETSEVTLSLDIDYTPEFPAFPNHFGEIFYEVVDEATFEILFTSDTLFNVIMPGSASMVFDRTTGEGSIS